MRREQQQRGRPLAGATRGQLRQPLSPGAIPNLVVILDADDVRGQRNALRAGSTWIVPESERLALKAEPVVQGANQPGGAPRKLLVIALVFSGEQGMDCVVEVVAPNAVAAVLGDVSGIVLVGFRHDGDGATEFAPKGMNALGYLGDDVFGRIVLDGLNSVKAQAVNVILGDPIQGVAGDESSDGSTAVVVVVDRFTPRGLVPSGEIRTELAKIVAFVAEVVVDDVQDHGEP